ncbi:MAG: hypothetical protein NTV44_06690 [Firmicutes bacterium]|nr:hypothetical protein [Bacillota bacterium]
MKKIITSSLCLATTIFLAFSLTGCSLESDVLRGAKRGSKALSGYMKTLYYYAEFDGTDSEDNYTGIYDPVFMEWERNKAKADVYFYEDDLYATIYSTFDTLYSDNEALGKTDYYGQFTEAQITSILDGANL